MSKYDEVMNCGPITLKRKDRSVILKSNMDAAEIEKSKQMMKAQFPRIKEEMFDLLSERLKFFGIN